MNQSRASQLVSVVSKVYPLQKVDENFIMKNASLAAISDSPSATERILKWANKKLKEAKVLKEATTGLVFTDNDTKYDFEKVKLATEMLYDGIGHPDWRNDPNTKESPVRIAKMWGILLGGYNKTTDQYEKTFPATSDNAVFSINNPFYSMCSHHFLPFVGTVSMAYIPNKSVIGLSKMPRIMRVHCKRLQLQENLTKEIADDLERILRPQGVAVQVKASHFCQNLRGACSHGAITVTTHVSGLFKTDLAARTEFLETIKVDPNVFRY